MCGICGYTKFNHTYEENIDLMLNEIKQRGPDFFSKISYKFVSLAHSRLSIIDLSKKPISHSIQMMEGTQLFLMVKFIIIKKLEQN